MGWLKGVAPLALVALVVTAQPAVAADKADITGTITFKGKPVGKGKIHFHPPVDKAVVANLNADGTYSAKGVPVGKLTVSVESKVLPKKYASTKTSGLTYEPVKGENMFDVQLD